MGDAYNKRKIEREALCLALNEEKGHIPLQGWYDSLRETDDGRFSKIKTDVARSVSIVK